MLLNRWPRMAIAVGFSVALHGSVTGETEAAPTVPRSHFRTSETIVPDGLPPIGYRYAGLAQREQQLLRRSFKLPMEAIAVANSPQDLLSAAIVQPLPDPNRPFLPVSSASNSAGDPFAGENNDAEQDGLGALGRLFAKEAALRGGESSAASSPTYVSSSTVSSVANDGDPFADGSAAASEAEPQAGAADPFGSDANEGDDFDDDPFGDF